MTAEMSPILRPPTQPKLPRPPKQPKPKPPKKPKTSELVERAESLAAELLATLTADLDGADRLRAGLLDIAARRTEAVLATLAQLADAQTPARRDHESCAGPVGHGGPVFLDGGPVEHWRCGTVHDRAAGCPPEIPGTSAIVAQLGAGRPWSPASAGRGVQYDVRLGLVCAAPPSRPARPVTAEDIAAVLRRGS